MTGFDVMLDGQALSDVSPSVLVIDVRSSAALETSAAARMGHGCFLTQQTRRSLTVTVVFEVHESDPEMRQEALDRVAAWCGGTLLTTPDRPGRQLRVVCTALPDLSARRWTDELAVAFTAYEQPFWEEESTCAASGRGTTAKLTLPMPGTADTVLDATAVNRGSSACRTLSIAANGCTLAFESLDLMAGEILRIAHDAQGRLTLTICGANGERSVYGKRTALSSDEIVLHPGANALTCTADKTMDWRCEGRGRWL